MPKQKRAKKVKRGVAKHRMYKCMRCEKVFPSLLGLKRHSNEHLKALEEMKMLREGHVPEETKLGAGFKGKNKIIVS